MNRLHRFLEQALRATRLTSLALVVCLLAATTPGLLVLCEGGDGHVAVEMAAAGCCDGEHGDPQSTMGACGSCIDRLLATPSAVVTPRIALDSGSAPIHMEMPARDGVQPSSRTDHGISRASGRGAPSGERSSRTIVLRC